MIKKQKYIIKPLNQTFFRDDPIIDNAKCNACTKKTGKEGYYLVPESPEAMYERTLILCKECRERLPC